MYQSSQYCNENALNTVIVMYNSQDMKSIQVANNGWMDNDNIAHSGILFTLKKENPIVWDNM